jgi:hypothetical protein
LTVVVVLPTPPFWLATQKILAMWMLVGLFENGPFEAKAGAKDSRHIPASVQWLRPWRPRRTMRRV